MPLADVDRCNRALRKYGADFHWYRNGRIIELLPGDADPTENDDTIDNEVGEHAPCAPGGASKSKPFDAETDVALHL